MAKWSHAPSVWSPTGRYTSRAGSESLITASVAVMRGQTSVEEALWEMWVCSRGGYVIRLLKYAMGKKCKKK